MYLKSANQSWDRKPKVKVRKNIPKPVVPSLETLVERLVGAGILEKKVPISSPREAVPLLLKLREEFKNGSDVNNKGKQAVFIWAFREFLKKDITF